MNFLLLLFCFTCCCSFLIDGQEASLNEQVAIWLRNFDQEYQPIKSAAVFASYAWNVNITKENKAADIAADLRESTFLLEAAKDAARLFDITEVTDPSSRRQLDFLKLRLMPLNQSELLERANVASELKAAYSQAKICQIDDVACKSPRLPLEPDLVAIMATSRNYTLLRYVWQKWRDASGRKMKSAFQRYMALENKGAQLNGFADITETWRFWYEIDEPDFRDTLEKLWRGVLPLYEELHTYARRKLRAVYPGWFDNNATIPAHILGNMWAQDWGNIFDLLVPYPNQSKIDITSELKSQGYTPRRIFEVGEHFFESVGLGSLMPSFWNLSLIEKPSDREVVCHGSAWDFYTAKDFAIKMCTDPTHDSFTTVHHELGHIYYDMLYRNNPILFRRGANPAFHEAVGDTISLSVSTPAYLRSVGLLHNYQTSEEARLNGLMQMALDRVAFFPYGYLLDLWRWDVASGKIPTSEINTAYWKLRQQYQGIHAPVQRTEEDFDPGAKYHVATATPYIRYFLSHFLEFQFHHSLCKAVEPSVPLHQCSIFNHTQAGNLIIQLLSFGASKPWPEALESLTGTRRVSAEPIMEYFEPLRQWLHAENTRAGDCYGWGHPWSEDYALPQPRCQV